MLHTINFATSHTWKNKTTGEQKEKNYDKKPTYLDIVQIMPETTYKLVL